MLPRGVVECRDSLRVAGLVLLSKCEIDPRLRTSEIFLLEQGKCEQLSGDERIVVKCARSGEFESPRRHGYTLLDPSREAERSRHGSK
jgi:hypothetical protein